MFNRVVLVLVLAATLFCRGGQAAYQANSPKPKPITKQGLLDALRIGGLTLPELVQFAKDRGVDFRVTPEVEKELRAAGAQTELIEAVRANYRGAMAAPAATSPLTKSEVATLIQVGTSADRIEQLVRERGVNFGLTPETRQELEHAGAGPALLETIAQHTPRTAAPPAPVPAPPPKPAAPAAASGSMTLKDVRKVFIEKMSGDLDQYVRAEISEQLAGRVTVVLVKEEADAYMVGSGERRTGTGAQIGLGENASATVTLMDRSGKQVLWSSEAGARSVLFGAVKRGGPRRVAQLLVANLKTAMMN